MPPQAASLDSTVPAAAPAPSGYISNPFKLLRPALDAFRVNLGTNLLLVLLSVALTLVAALPVVVALARAFMGAGLPENPNLDQIVAVLTANLLPLVTTFLLSAVLAVILLSWATIGATRAYLAGARGQKLGLGEALSMPVKTLMRSVWTGLLAGIVIFLGFLFFIVPGIIFLVWFLLVPYVFVDEGLSGTAALRRSRELVRGHWWEMASTALVVEIFGLLVLIPYLGDLAYLIVTVALSTIFAVRYVQLKELKAAGAPSPRIHPLNYLAIALGILGSIASSTPAGNNGQPAVNQPAFEQQQGR